MKRMFFRKLGSNQYKETFKKIGKKHIKFMQWHWLFRFLLVIGLAIVFLLAFSYWYVNSPVKPIVSPVVAEEPITSRIVENKKTTKIQVINMIVSEFSEFGSQTVMTALRIANCESKFDETAEHWNRNGSVDRGIFMINSIHGYADYELFGAYNNILIAKRMFVRNGYSWNAWVCK